MLILVQSYNRYLMYIYTYTCCTRSSTMTCIIIVYIPICSSPSIPLVVAKERAYFSSAVERWDRDRQETRDGLVRSASLVPSAFHSPPVHPRSRRRLLVHYCTTVTPPLPVKLLNTRSSYHQHQSSTINYQTPLLSITKPRHSHTAIYIYTY